uniref:Uncharacterized protein n=1 Tax=Anguilla anguilla TaxID=7936 RepID=A0A0E9XYA5_ANGAN
MTLLQRMRNSRMERKCFM